MKTQQLLLNDTQHCQSMTMHFFFITLKFTGTAILIAEAHTVRLKGPYNTFSSDHQMATLRVYHPTHLLPQKFFSSTKHKRSCKDLSQALSTFSLLSSCAGRCTLGDEKRATSARTIALDISDHRHRVAAVPTQHTRSTTAMLKYGPALRIAGVHRLCPASA